MEERLSELEERLAEWERSLNFAIAQSAKVQDKYEMLAQRLSEKNQGQLEYAQEKLKDEITRQLSEEICERLDKLEKQMKNLEESLKGQKK